MGTVTALEVQKRNKERVNVFLDDEYAFSLTLLEAARLRKGQHLTEDEIALLRDDDSIHRAVDHAARFLAYRPRSENEVRQNLKKKDYGESIIDVAVERLHRMGYLDDRAFARFWVENRDTFKPRGPRALQYELQQKGVSRTVIHEVLEGFDDIDAAYRAAQDKARRLRGLTQAEFSHKLGSFLQRRGFGFGIAHDVIEQLIETYATEDPAFFAEPENDEPAEFE